MVGMEELLPIGELRAEPAVLCEEREDVDLDRECSCTAEHRDQAAEAVDVIVDDRLSGEADDVAYRPGRDVLLLSVGEMLLLELTALEYVIEPTEAAEPEPWVRPE